MADAYESQTSHSHNFNGPLANVMSAHFCAAIPDFRIMEFDIDEVPWKAKLLTKPYTIENGEFLLPSGAGCGHGRRRSGHSRASAQDVRAQRVRHAAGAEHTRVIGVLACVGASEGPHCGHAKLLLLQPSS